MKVPTYFIAICFLTLIKFSNPESVQDIVQNLFRAYVPTNAYEPTIISRSALARIRTFLKDEIRNNNALIPKFIRIGFHTCFGDEGCNGCLDLTDSHNKGLRAAYKTLISWYQKFEKRISLADFVALAATEAVQAATFNADCGARSCGRSLPFMVGRQTCQDPKNPPAVNFIDGDESGGLDRLMTSFGLSRTAAVALIGFHSLGRCRRADSGFEGPWDDDELAADNGYFIHMRREKFAVDPHEKLVQWKANGKMFLTADLECRYIIPIKRNGNPACAKDVSHCALAPTSRLVDRYALDTNVWLNDAIPAFLQMIEKSNSQLFEA